MKLFRLFVSFGVLVVIVLFTALLAPYFVDWTAYKRDFEIQASRILGQPVKVAGAANIRILPLPKVSFSKLSIGENADKSPMMTVERFAANVELIPFLSGEVKIVDMALDSPVFNIIVGQDGKIAWTSRQELIVDPGQVRLDNLQITNASVNLSGLAGGRTIEARGIDADINAQSLYGPWRMDAAGLLDGVATKLGVTTGRLQDDNSIRLKIDGQRASQPYGLSADGTVSLLDDILSWNGKFVLDPAGDAAISKKPSLPVKVTGDFALRPTDLKIAEYRMEIGAKEDPFVLTGSADAGFREKINFKLKVDGRQMDLDRIAVQRGAVEQQNDVAPKTEETDNNIENRVRLLRDIINQIPLPDVEGEIDLEIPAIIAGDTLIREVSSLIKPISDGWEIVRLKAFLPGNTAVEATGRVGIGEDFGFDGHLVVASRQPSGFASWATGNVAPAIRRLKFAGFEADTSLTLNQTNFENLELILDDNRLTGRLQRLAPADTSGGKTPPAILAEVKGNIVDLDDLSAVASLVTPVGKLAADHAESPDYEVTITADLLRAFDLQMQNVDTQLRFSGGDLAITRLSVGDVLGTSISSKGQIAGLLKAPTGKLELSIKGEDPTALFEELRNRWLDFPAMRALAQDVELSGNLDANLVLEARLSTKEEAAKNLEAKDSGSTAQDSRGRFALQGNIGGTKIDGRGGFAGNFGDRGNLKIDLSLTGENSDADSVLQQLGIREWGYNTLLGGIDGALVATLEASGSKKNGFATNINLNNDQSIFSAKGLVKADGSDLDFEFTVGSSNVAGIVPAFGYSVPGLNGTLGDVAPLSMTGQFKLANNIATIDIANGQVSGNSIIAKLNRKIGEAGRPMISGDVALGNVSLPLLAGLGLGSGADNGLDLEGSWPTDEFITPMFRGLDAELKITAKEANIGLGQLADNAFVDFGITDGSFNLTNVKLNWMGSNIGGSVEMKQTDGIGLLQGQYSVAEMPMAPLLSALGMPEIGIGKLQISGTLSASGKSPKALMSQLSGSGTIAVENAELIGINTAGLPEVLRQSDQEGFKLEAATVAPLLRQSFLNGRMPIKVEVVPFAINNGVGQLRNVTVESDGQKAEIDAMASLVSGNIEAEISLKPPAGKDHVAGAEPEVRFTWKGPKAEPLLATDADAMLGYLSLRAFEAEQRRVEILQANILEKQRLRFDVLKANERERFREAERAETLRLLQEQQAALEAERLAREEEAKRLEAEQKEAARIAAEEAERQRQEAERAEKKRLADEQAERERIAKEILKQAELAKQRAQQEEKARLAEQKKLDAERERLLQEKLAKEKLAEEKLAEEKLKQDQLAKKRENKAAATEQTKPDAGADGAQTIPGKQGFEAHSLPEPDLSTGKLNFDAIENLLFNLNKK